jgi:4-hydroxy-2-oxoheptanedioate aldolase
VPNRVNRAIELLEQDQTIYYYGSHTGQTLSREQGRIDARTWADYINVGMEHGSLDMAGLAEYMKGLVEGGPTSSGHRTPAVIVEAPVGGIDEPTVRYNAWQFRHILARGVHGILLCQAESADAVRAFVESCRYPHKLDGLDPDRPSPIERIDGADWRPTRRPDGRPYLGVGTRGRGSEASAAPIWGLSAEEYTERCDVWPLNPTGELLLGVKIESPEGVRRCEEILAVPGIGFAELGPSDLGLSLGYLKVEREAYPPEMKAARQRILGACREHGVAFLDGANPDTIVRKIDEGVRVVSGGREDTARVGRAHSRRAMPV